MAGDEQLELDDDLNVDETAEIETESFPDPDLDVEPEVEESAPASSMEGAEANLPTPPAPPIPEYAPPVDDGGFTPVPTYQQDAPARQAPPAQPQVQFYSVAQLTEAVNNGIITEDQKIEQLQLQNRELAKREALQAFEQQSRQQSLTQQLSEYSTLVPGWDQIGTEANKRASAEYKVLLGRGLQEDNTTKLLALERAFGPAHRIKEIRATQTRTAAQRDTTQEVGRRGSPPPSSRRKDPLTVIPLEEKRWYKDKIDKGIYKNWDEVRAEIQWAATQTTNPRLRDKHAGLMK